jgi:DNA-binding transcriptional regulator YiaG
MKTKTLKYFTYDGLGFPIKLQNVLMLLVDGEWTPKIDVRKVAENAIRELPYQKERLSGNQIKFIRTYFEMSLREFASQVVNESHNAVAKWEKFGTESTNMDENIESMLRLYIIDKVSTKSKRQAQDFLNSFRQIRSMNFLKKSPSPLLMEAV